MNLLRVGKVEALKIYRYRNRYRGKSLFTYRLLTELRIPLPYISVTDTVTYTVKDTDTVTVTDTNKDTQVPSFCHVDIFIFHYLAD